MAVTILTLKVTRSCTALLCAGGFSKPKYEQVRKKNRYPKTKRNAIHSLRLSKKKNYKINKTWFNSFGWLLTQISITEGRLHISNSLWASSLARCRWVGRGEEPLFPSPYQPAPRERAGLQATSPTFIAILCIRKISHALTSRQRLAFVRNVTVLQVLTIQIGPHAI